ncbi:TRAP transporter large permease [Neptunomonas japonica]|uniref:TRAP transporter large permease protein n=1 Tax=Neptunomonas japonica JAMM 1380 TaxID=1441457 RepID=A0A7R6P9F7_9GAMM|nr:TRAP transporter large permease subunit [Neptunomonas japonica]BBB29688.1 TRAP dicarboxylate transporter DctM subunit [Neptunomonas japonica JAMM 1380]
MEINEILVICMFASFVLFLFSGIPVAFVLAGIGVIFAGIGYFADMYLDATTGLDYLTLGIVVNRIYKIMDNWVLVALPMFIFMGLMLDKSGVAERLMLSMQRVFGKLHGGLAITVTLLGMILAAATGIIGASVVLLGLMSLPIMLKQGYNKPLALGTICGAGTLGILIPPSIMLVIMADQLSLSVGDLFMGAVFPGLLLGSLYVIYIVLIGFFKPTLVPLSSNQPPMEWALVWDLVKAIIPPLTLVFAVLGSVFSGIATPTEASGVGALGALALAAVNKKLNTSVFIEVLRSTFNNTAYIFAIILGATCFALVMRELGGDELIESAFSSLNVGDYETIFIILAVVFLLGFVLDWIEITLIILPLLAPIISGLSLDVNGYGSVDNPQLVWFVMLVAVTLQTSFLTPPVGFALFYLKGVCPPDVTLMDLYKGVIPFIIIQVVALLIILFNPSLVTWLPAMAY